MKKVKFVKNKGITLVALVITIVLLLILAGISIATLTSSGLFENTRLAEQESKNAQEKEEAILGDYENKIEGYLNGNRNNNPITGLEETVLWEGSINAVGQKAELNDSIENYRYILLETTYGNGVNKGETSFYDTWLRVSRIKQIGYISEGDNTASHAFICMFSTQCIAANFIDNNTLSICYTSNPISHLNAVLGIK